MWNRFGGRGGSKTASRGLRAVDDLTTAVLAALSEHVAIVDGDGKIIAVNRAWKSFDCERGDSGLQRSGIGSNYLEVCEAAERARSGGVEGAVLGLRAVLEGSRSHFSLIYVCLSGSGRQWFRMSVTPIGSPPDGAIISHASVEEPAPAGEAPLTATNAAVETGEPLLRVLTENLAKTIGAHFAFLSEVVDQRAGRVRLIALWTGDRFEKSFEYDVDGTPCRDVLAGNLCLYPVDVQELFPNDAWLKEIAAECYLGVPLFSVAGEVLGHVGVIHDQSLDNFALAEQVLRAVGAQASVELERMRLLRSSQKSERTGRALLNATSESAMLLQPDGTIVDVNEVAAVRLGRTVEGAVGANVFDLLPPELAATRKAATDKVLASRKPLRIEEERAGTHFESSISPVLDPQGNVECVAIFASDVTARKVAEERSQRNEAKIRSLVESANEGIVSVRSDGRIELANSAAERMFGYDRGELDGQSIETLVPEGHRTKHAGLRIDYISDPEPRPMGMGPALVGRRKNGTEFSVEISLSPLEGTYDGQTMATISDITDRERMEEQLRQSAERNAALVAAIPDMMFTLDRHGVYLDFVPAEGYGPYVTADQLLGKTVYDVLPTSLAQDTMQGLEAALDTGRQQPLAYELELDDGRHDYEARIVKSKEDEALMIVRDVTAARRLEREEQLRRERDTLEGKVEKEMLGKNPYGLTFRELTVLHLAANGEADKAIADQLGISTSTVSKHVAHILGKMAAASRTEACVRAVREGLLT